MPRASGLLLREIAGAGAGLWVVGDARQAIYRFRGAAPVNMRLFPQDFPGAKVRALGRNYRSQKPIVDVFAGLAPRMRAARGGPPFTPWEPDRPTQGGRVLIEVAEDDDAEGDGLAREIERQRAAGIPYRDQAVLCRLHAHLGRISARLERAGVPVLYLGDLFERPEVRDMLALVALACKPDGRGLVRVARFPEYQVPLADVRLLLASSSAAWASPPSAAIRCATASTLGRDLPARYASAPSAANSRAAPRCLKPLKGSRVKPPGERCRSVDVQIADSSVCFDA